MLIAELHVTEYADSAAKLHLLPSGAMASFGLLTLSPLAIVQFARALSDNPFACHAAQDSPTRDQNNDMYIYIYMSMCNLIGALKYERGFSLEKGTP